ncbi:MAG: hypothetical protein ACOCW6_05190, partial [Spirochaetota bacterium]
MKPLFYSGFCRTLNKSRLEESSYHSTTDPLAGILTPKERDVRITSVRTHLVGKYLFVTVETNTGLVGTGES